MTDSDARGLIDALAANNSTLAALCFRAASSGFLVFDQQAAFFMLGDKSTLFQLDIVQHYDGLVARLLAGSDLLAAQVSAATRELGELHARVQSLIESGAAPGVVAMMIVDIAGVIDRAHSVVRTAIV